MLIFPDYLKVEFQEESHIDDITKFNSPVNTDFVVYINFDELCLFKYEMGKDPVDAYRIVFKLIEADRSNYIYWHFKSSEERYAAYVEMRDDIKRRG